MPQAIPAIVAAAGWVVGTLGTVGAAVGVTGALSSVVVGGMIVGAAVGGIAAAVTGGDILSGALYGAVGGAAIGASAYGIVFASMGEFGILGYSASGVEIDGATAALSTTVPTSTTTGGFTDGMGAALISGVGTMADSFLGDKGETAITLAELKAASDERMNTESAKASKEIAKIRASASGGGGSSSDALEIAILQAEHATKQNALDRGLAREQLSGDIQTAADDRSAAIQMSDSEIQESRDARQSSIDESGKALDRARAGASGNTVSGGSVGSVSTKTISDIADRYREDEDGAETALGGPPVKEEAI